MLFVGVFGCIIVKLVLLLLNAPPQPPILTNSAPSVRALIVDKSVSNAAVLSLARRNFFEFLNDYFSLIKN